MSWKNLQSWLKGAIIADSLFVLWIICLFVFGFLFSSERRGYLLPSLIIGLVFWGLIGALIGWIVWKIRSKNKKGAKKK